MIIVKTPLRVSLFGGGTDYPSYLEHNDSIVIGSAINKFNYVYVNGNPLNNDSDYRLNYSIRESVPNISDIKHNSIRECFRYFEIEPPFELHSLAELPARTGLGSSSAFTVGLINALSLYKGERLKAKKVTELAHVIEIEKIGENVGLQDQILTSLGGFNIVEFKDGGFALTNEGLNQKTIASLEQNMVMFYLGSQRSAPQILDEQIARNINKKNDSTLREMTDIALEAKKLLTDSDASEPVHEIGKLLCESWALKKKLSSQVSNDFVDEIYTKAMNNGAFAGKLLGAGKTGMMLFLAKPDQHKALEAALSPLKRVNFEFCWDGSKPVG